MFDDLTAEGYPLELVVLSDANAMDFTTRTTVPIFRDPSAGRLAWAEMQPGAVKHDTFVFDTSGTRTFFWDASAHMFSTLSSDIRAAVEAIGK